MAIESLTAFLAKGQTLFETVQFNDYARMLQTSNISFVTNGNVGLSVFEMLGKSGKIINFGKPRRRVNQMQIRLTHRANIEPASSASFQSKIMTGCFDRMIKIKTVYEKGCANHFESIK